MRTIAIVCAVVLGVVSLGRVSAENFKTDICHYQEETDSWKLLSLPQPTAQKHLDSHDDAPTGYRTTQTNTALDWDCVKVEGPCPCGNAGDLNEKFESLQFVTGPTTERCESSADLVALVRSDAGFIPGIQMYVQFAPQGNQCFYDLSANDFADIVPGTILPLTEAEATACSEELLYVISQLNDCP